jgi:hypothetical protein
MIDCARVTTGFGGGGRGAPIQARMQYLTEARAFAHMLMPDVHAARVESLGNGVAGVMAGAKASIHAIGAAYAGLTGIKSKSGIKQIDRLLSNEKLELDVVFVEWTKFIVSERQELVIALDWTDFDADDHTTLCAYTATTHGRATPLAWKTVRKSELRGRRSATEHQLIENLHRWIEPKVKVTLLADRGFGDTKLYEALALYGWDFVIRFRGDIQVEHDGVKMPARAWIKSSGRATMLRDVMITNARSKVAAAVLVHDKKMKDGWCLATTLVERTASEVVKLYGKRFTIEESFRDAKDLHFGLGLSATHVRDPGRRDRLLLLLALAIALLTLLGAAGERCGLDASLKANTVKTRTISLFRQGLMWWEAIPMMPEQRLHTLMKAFDEVVREHAFARVALGIL